MKILLAGGGTLGPVTPLLALVEAWRKRDAGVSFVLAGTPSGPERALADSYGLAFTAITPARLPRFFSFEWLSFPARGFVALVQSWKLMRRERPDLIIGAGGYTQVPIIFVGWLLRVPSFVLQTDVLPLLSNRLVLPFVRKIFIGLNETAASFPTQKTLKIGVPVRESLLRGSSDRAFDRFGLVRGRPSLLVLGGGTGSMWLNGQMALIALQLAKEMNVLHITGRGKNLNALTSLGAGYVAVEHVEEGLEDIYAAADLVIARAGMGTISELSALGKPSIIIAIPRSSQQANARVLERHCAARVLSQESIGSRELLEEIRGLMSNEDERRRIGEAVHRVFKTDVADEIIKTILF